MKKYLIIIALILSTGFIEALTNSVPAEDVYFKNVAMIQTQSIENDGSSLPGYCNATFISNLKLVTAAHCLIGPRGLVKPDLTIYIGVYFYKTLPDGSLKRVGYKIEKHIQTKAKFNLMLARPVSPVPPDTDMAEIILTEPVDFPANFKYATVISRQEWSSIKSNLSGYSPIVVTNNLFEEPSLDTKRWAQIPNLTYNNRYLESRSTARVQEGDSGAPVFVRIGPDWKLVGIVKGRADSGFSSWDVFGSLDRVRDLL